MSAGSRRGPQAMAARAMAVWAGVAALLLVVGVARAVGEGTVLDPIRLSTAWSWAGFWQLRSDAWLSAGIACLLALPIWRNAWIAVGAWRARQRRAMALALLGAGLLLALYGWLSLS